jgi:hypothetical protein
METNTADVTGDGNVPQVADANANVADATQKLGWRSELPDALKENDTFKSYATKNDLWKGHIDLSDKVKDYESKLANAILKPGENATPEEMAAYRKAIGVPDKPEDYQFTKPKLPDGLPYDESIETWFRNTAYELDLSSSAAGGLFEKWNGLMVDVFNKQTADKKAYVDSLMSDIKKEWGNDYNVKAEVAKRGQEKLISVATDQKFKEWLGNYKPESNPMLFRLFSLVGENAMDTKFVEGKPPGRDIKPGLVYDKTPKI